MNKIDVKILFVDIDFTIFNHEIQDFDHESIKILKKAQENGYLVYISTARPYHSVVQLGLFNYFSPDGIITSNGSVIFNKDKIIYGKIIPQEIVNNVCKSAIKHHMNVELVGEKTRFVVSKRFKEVKKLYSTFYDVVPEYKKYNNEIVYTMLLIGSSKYDGEILSYLSKDMYHYRFGELGMDMSCSPTQKGYAIDLVLKYHNIKKENSLSIGDSELDLSMFEATKYSIAVGNANDHVKSKATHVAPSISEHGVGKILLEVLKI